MNVSQKCQYALRALLELAKRPGDRPTTIGDIAAAQAIPARFLELILGELRQGGFVRSRRGVQGGYLLARPGAEISLTSVIEFVDGPLSPVACIDQERADCPLSGRCALADVWREAREALSAVYDRVSLADLASRELALARSSLDYAI